MLSLLIVIPLLTGLIVFALQNNQVKIWSLASSILMLIFVLCGFLMPCCFAPVHATWIPSMNASFSLEANGLSKILILLTAFSYFVILLATYKNVYTQLNRFYGLLMLSYAGLIGVFVSHDALLFYLCWELVLIPIYFLCSQWGGERRIKVTFTFFIYTFLGSLCMLAGILYLYYKTPDASFSWESFVVAGQHLSLHQQKFLFWLFFLAFAIKIPMFPFHGWQPNTYSESPIVVTMILSGLMAKMGIFGILQWGIPICPLGVTYFSTFIIALSVIGMLYASLIAIKQDEIKKLIAYSSMAHMGLMVAASFSHNNIALQGLMIQLFNHGIVIIGLWIIADQIEQQTQVKKMSELGGLAQVAPNVAIVFVLFSLANLALPLTSTFVGEFMMFDGLFSFNKGWTVVALISVILVAVYSLGMIQKIFFGDKISFSLKHKHGMPLNAYAGVWILLVIVIFFGVYPSPLIGIVKNVMTHFAYIGYFK